MLRCVSCFHVVATCRGVQKSRLSLIAGVSWWQERTDLTPRMLSLSYNLKRRTHSFEPSMVTGMVSYTPDVVSLTPVWEFPGVVPGVALRTSVKNKPSA